MPTGIDESWSRANWARLHAMGVRVVSLYLSRDPSKNAKPGDVRRAHEHGIGVLLNWESQPGAPLLGAHQGHADAVDWVYERDALIKAVGYKPDSKLSAIFSCDRDTNPNEYSRIDAYYKAVGYVVGHGARVGTYAEADLIDHLHRRGLIDDAWQTYAWSGGRLSPSANFYQYLNGQSIGGASVDYDRVINAARLGAWWPPGHAHAVPAHRPSLTPTKAAPVAPSNPAPLALIRCGGSKYHYPVLVGAEHNVVLTDPGTVAQLLAAGVRTITAAPIDYNRIRKGAIK